MVNISFWNGGYLGCFHPWIIWRGCSVKQFVWTYVKTTVKLCAEQDSATLAGSTIVTFPQFCPAHQTRGNLSYYP